MENDLSKEELMDMVERLEKVSCAVCVSHRVCTLACGTLSAPRPRGLAGGGAGLAGRPAWELGTFNGAGEGGCRAGGRPWKCGWFESRPVCAQLFAGTAQPLTVLTAPLSAQQGAEEDAQEEDGDAGSHGTRRQSHNLCLMTRL